MTVVTRFAPSPTGFLHIGGARTALFNWLYARHHDGRFLLRIEDTDKARSTDEATQAILDGMKWLGLDHDGDVNYQSEHEDRHRQVAYQLLKTGHAYECYVRPQELEKMREAARKEKKSFRFRSIWRDQPDMDKPHDSPVIRLKVPHDGDLTLNDHVQGKVKMPLKELDDLVLLRSDGSPTYMLSVVVDDFDMKITHVIRGDDHLTNAFKQTLIYNALGWPTPEFAHVPMIHGPDGAKLSKRHGALSVTEYKDMGFLPEAMINYLLRLGWGHGDEEILPRDKAIRLFDFKGIGKSPARFDMDKLRHINSHYMRETDNTALLKAAETWIHDIANEYPTGEVKNWYIAGMDDLKERAQTLIDIAEAGKFYTYTHDVPKEDAAQDVLKSEDAAYLPEMMNLLEKEENWTHEKLFAAIKDFAKKKDLKVGKLAGVLRAAITGTTKGPSIFNVMETLGRDETFRRLKQDA